MRRRWEQIGAITATASLILLVALVIDGRNDSVRLLAKCDSLSASDPSCSKSASLQEADAPLSFGTDGSIRADTVRQWRKKMESSGDFPVPDHSFFDSTNSDVWTDRETPEASEVGFKPPRDDGFEPKGFKADDDLGPNVWPTASDLDLNQKKTSWLKPARWIADRRASASQQRDSIADDHHSEYQDGHWWPYELGVGPSMESKRVKEARDNANGAARNWKDIYNAVVRRYDNPTFDPYMEQEYQRLVVGPAKRVRQVRQAHQEGGKPTDIDVAMSGQLEGAEDAVRSLDREASRALPLLDAMFHGPSVNSKPTGLPGTAAWPEKWPADAGITHGVFRNNKSGMEGGEDEPKSWQEVSAASERMRGGGEGSDGDDGLEPKDQSDYGWRESDESTADSPLGYLDTGHIFSSVNLPSSPSHSPSPPLPLSL